MSNKNIGLALYLSVGLAFLAAIIESGDPVTADTLYMIAGLGMIVFGLFGGYRLRE